MYDTKKIIPELHKSYRALLRIGQRKERTRKSYYHSVMRRNVILFSYQVVGGTLMIVNIRNVYITAIY